MVASSAKETHSGGTSVVSPTLSYVAASALVGLSIKVTQVLWSYPPIKQKRPWLKA